MSRFEFKLPDIGEGVTEGEVVNWLVQAGDPVTQDQDIVEVMTDKATVTIGSPRAGRVVELRGSAGDVVPVGAVLVVLDVDEGKPGQPTAEPVTASAVGDLREKLPGIPDQVSVDGPALAAPATRKLARELGIDLSSVRASGPGGRITREDVERASAGASAQAAPVARPAPPPPGHAEAKSGARAGAPARPAAAPLAPSEGERRVPIRGLRKRIYENMARSKHTAAHFTYVEECDVGELRAVRDRAREVADRDGVKLTFLPFVVKAVVASLRRHPALNCLVDDAAQEMVLKSSYDIGIAIATDAGLTVPVLRGADGRSVLDVAKELERLSEEARAGKTRREDLGGSSFTITSLGKLGGLFATPVVNYPEVAILGIHEIKRRPVVRGDAIAIGDVMLISLSFDHRIIDGHVGAAFAQEVRGYLEHPDRLLVELR